MSEKNTMLAMVLKAQGQLEYEHRQIPSPGKGEMLIHMVCAGICGSDIHAYHGLQPSLKYPCIMGHEDVGVVAVINGKSDFKIGDRVVIDPSYRCGTCELCRTGRENICENLKVLGVHCDGGFAEYCLCAIDMAHKIPDALEDEIAVFTEPMSIAVHALRRVAIHDFGRVLVIGAGPIGLALVLALKTVAAKIAVFDILPNRLKAAQNMGVDLVLNSEKQGDNLENLAVNALGGYVDVVFDTVSNQFSVQITENLVKRGGQVVIVGMARKETGFHLLPTLKKELVVYGTRMTTPKDFADGLDILAHADKRLIKEIVTNSYPLSQAIEAIEFVEKHPEKGIKTIIKIS